MAIRILTTILIFGAPILSFGGEKPVAAKLVPVLLKGSAFDKKESEPLIAKLPKELKPIAEKAVKSISRLQTKDCAQKGNSCLKQATENVLEYMDQMSKTYPSDFEVQKTYTNSLFFIGSSPQNFGIEGFNLKEKAIAETASLPSRFPNEPLAYGSLAFVYSFDESKKAEVKKLIDRCLNLNPQEEYCLQLKNSK